MKAIYAALAKAQSQMGKAIKDSSNPHFRSKYADLGNVMDACIPALTANGIAVIQVPGTDEVGPYVDTVLGHESGESVSCRVHLILDKKTMQGYGSAQTYARRYGLMAMAGIAPEDDDGNAASERPAQQAPRREPPQQKPELTDAEKRDFIKAKLSECKTSQAVGAFWMKVADKVDDLPPPMRAELETAYNDTFNKLHAQEG